MAGVVVLNPVAIADGYGNIVSVVYDNTNNTNELLVKPPYSVVSNGNSSSTPLGSSGVFTGTSEEVRDFATITLQVYSSHASNTDGLSVQYSTDDINWDGYDTFSIPTNTAKFFTFAPQARYFRVVYTNGPDAQTEFRLQVIYHYHRTKPSSHRISDPIVNEDDAELVKAIITGQKPNGNFDNVALDSDGRIKVSTPSDPSDSDTQDIAFGKVLMGGAAQYNTFACRRTTYNEQTTGAGRSMSSTSANDSSAGTGARQVRITYFNSTLTEKKIEIVTLNGTTAVNTAETDICFIEKMEVISVGSGGTNAGTITLFVSTGGSGGTIGTIALANPGSVNQDAIDLRTYWAHHYVLDGYTCTIVTFDAGTQGNQNAEVFLSSVNPLSSTSPDVQISDSITVGLSSPTTPRSVPNTIKVTGPARVTMYMSPAGNNTAFYGSFDFWE